MIGRLLSIFIVYTYESKANINCLLGTSGAAGGSPEGGEGRRRGGGGVAGGRGSSGRRLQRRGGGSCEQFGHLVRRRRSQARSNGEASGELCAGKRTVRVSWG
jgi:hypothetical protein